MRQVRARAMHYGAAFLVSASLPAIAMAQTTSYSKARALIDDNGVDLVTGTYVKSLASIAVGGANGLSWSQGYDDLWAAGIAKSVNPFTGKTELLVVVGGVRNVFVQNGTTYTAKELDGSSLSLGGTIYTYKSATGDVVNFLKTDTSVLVDLRSREALPTDITNPNGRKTMFTYRKITVQVEGADGFKNRTYARLQSISVQNYQIHATYVSDTATDISGVASWNMLTRLTALDGSVDACALNATSCATTIAWPRIDFDGGNRLTDAMGRVTTITNGTASTAIRYPGSTSDDVTIGYANGIVSSVVRGGVTTTYSFSDSGTTRTATVTRGSLPAKVWTFDIPTAHLLSEQWKTDPTGPAYTRSYSYDPGTLLLSTITEPEGNYTKYSYDALGRQTEMRMVAKVPGTPPDLVTTSGYDDATCTNPVTCFRPNTVTDPKGKVTRYTYDPTHGGVKTMVLPAGASAIQPQVTYSYAQLDANGTVSATGIWVPTGTSTCLTTASCAGGADERKMTIAYGSGLAPLSVTVASGDGAISVTSGASYDAIGNLKTTTDPLGAVTRRYYNATRQLTGIVSPDPDGSGALKNRGLTMHYDAAGRVDMRQAGTANADGSNFVSLQEQVIGYDTAGRKVSDRTTAGGTTYGVTHYSYDAVGRPLCTAVRMDPGQWNGQTDACAAQTTGTGGPDRVVRQDYDGVGRVISVTSAYGTADASTDATSYNPNGTVKTVTDGNGNVTNYAYDGFDRLLTTTYPGGTYEQLGYDANGNVTSRLLRDGKSISYGYDALNRLTSKTRPKTIYWETDQSYGYDLLGNLTQASDSNGRVLSFGYDALGRRTSQGDNWYANGRATYQYDAAGRRTRMTWNDGTYFSYDYLVTGEMSAIRDSAAAALVTFSYDDLGRRTSLSRANGTVTGYGYDAASRLTQLTQDLAGAGSDVTVGFGYNPAGQITSRTSSNDAYAWTGAYNVDRSYTVNALNQLTAAGSTVLGYDKRGNLGASGSTGYGYTADNQLASGPGVGLAYDPVGRLFNMDKDPLIAGQNVSTTLTYDGADVIAETNNGSGALLRRYVYGPGSDEPLIWYEGTGLGDRRWLHADERGSVIAVSDDAGNAIRINSYDEFGIPGANNLGRFQYTGQKWIPSFGLYDYKARAYSPTLGRFLQTDPIGYGDGMNWYNYVGSDPVNNTDPSGLGPVGDEPTPPCNGSSQTTQTAGGKTETVCTPSGPTIIVSLNRPTPSPYGGTMGYTPLTGIIEPPSGNGSSQPQSVTVDPSCAGIPAVANPAVQKAASKALAQARQAKTEFGFFATRNVRGSPGYTAHPAFTSGIARKILGADIVANTPGSISVYDLSPVYVHTHQNNPPPSPAGEQDGISASAQGLPVVAIDRAGTMTCKRPQQ